MLDGKKILYSGMQATGTLTLGNYLGALKNWVNLTDEYECIYGVMDFTFPYLKTGAGRVPQKCSFSLCIICSGRIRPGEKLYLLSVPCIRTCRIKLDIRLLYLYGRVKPYDTV